MKKMNKKLKPWVSNLLIIISFISVLVASGECDNFYVFAVKTAICCLIFSFNSYLLIKYGSLKEVNENEL